MTEWIIEGNVKMELGRFLAVDTSTASLTIAVLEQNRMLGELNTVAERNHSIGLLPNIRQLLAELGMKPRDLQAVAVGRGPGSYTGVRIGVSTAKTFAWALGIPLLGVSSLEALAYGAALADRAAEAGGAAGAGDAAARDGRATEAAQRASGSAANTEVSGAANAIASGAAGVESSGVVDAIAGSAADAEAGGAADAVASSAEAGKGSAAVAAPGAGAVGATWIVPLMDARRTQAFTAVFAAAGEGTAPPAWRRVRADGIRLMGDWADELLAQLADPGAAGADAAADAARPRRIVFAGDTAGFAEPIARVAAQAGCAVAMLPHALQASALGQLAWPRLARGERADVHGFVPNYAQLPEAEVKLLAKAQKGDD